MAQQSRDGESGTDEQRIIERGLARVRDESGLPVAFWGRVGADGNRLHLEQFSGDVIGALRGLAVGFGTGIGGKAASMRRPMAVDNYVEADRISHHYDHVIRAERLQSVLAIPIVLSRNVRAVMYGATRESTSLGERALRSAAEGAREIEQQLAVYRALRGRASSAQQVVQGDGSGDAPSAADWETVRATFAKLRVMAASVDDPKLRLELATLADGLTAPEADPGVHLTAREIDVLACVSQGLTNAETGRTLGLGPETVKSYLRSSMRRLDAGTRWGAVIAARRAGLLP
ncbi:LuxR C-terminal-related transcriptional regulator [Mariniluteicoccus endophyticus]